MTEQELLKLKAEADAAAQAADAATKDAEANPTDQTKAAMAKEAVQKSAEATAKLTAAAQAAKAAAVNVLYVPSNDTTDEINGNRGKIALLGIYLILMILASVYLLGGLMMAETDENRINNILADRRCCSPTPTESPTSTVTPTPVESPLPSPTPSTTPSPTPGNTNGATGNSGKTTEMN